MINYFRCIKVEFYALKQIAMSNVLDAPQKKEWGVGASLSVLLFSLHQVRLISDRYLRRDKYDVLGGIIITLREVITVTRREQLCTFMKHEDFGNHELI